MPTASFAQNLVQNPGFETANLTNWPTTGNVDIWGIGYATGMNPNSGFWYANPYGAGGTLSQGVNITTGGRYNFTFYYNAQAGETWNLTARVGGTTAFSGIVTNTVGMQKSTSFVFLPTGTATILFDASSIYGYEFGIDDVSLTLLQSLLLSILPSNTPINPTNVAAAIDAFTNAGGTLPAGFNNLFSLTPNQLVAALNQLSGEAATGAQTGAFELMNSFLNLMTDPSLDAGNGNGVGLASGFAPERQALPADVALAYASMLKAPPARSSQPWSAWGSAYGGTNNATGDATVVGSHDVRTNTWGIAAGLDYRLSPDTKIGFALGGAGTNWGLSDGLGGGKSDAFQAGIYGLTRSGPAYLSGALAYSSYWVSTDRTAVAGDQLTANFNAYGIGGRLEGGYRFATPVVGLTPYAALQAQSFHIPSYSETDVTGGGFGLAYNAHTASDTRSELGARLDKQVALDNGAVLALRGRAAWAHDWVTDPSLTAAFLALPGGGGFVVNGATPAHDSALITAGAEIKLRSGWSVMAKFDGEFASGSQTYTGTGKLRYTW